MPAPISVIIPTLNAAATLGPCLGAVAHGLENGAIAQVIFADGGSIDDIAKVAGLAGAMMIQSPKGRGSQLATGAANASADWLLFLHADTVLAKYWPQRALAHIANNPGRAAYFKLKFNENSISAKIVAGWANRRAKTFDMPYGDQGLLISRALYDQVGGYSDLPLMEDVAIAKALKNRLTMLECTATTSAARYQENGWIRQSLRNFGTLIRFKMGVDPKKLAQQYNR